MSSILIGGSTRNMNIERSDLAITIYSSFAKTKYGRRLAKHIRYARYNTADVSNQEWINMLGSDVDNLAHMLITFQLVEEFCAITVHKQPNLISETERTLLAVAAVIHDQAEAIISDITFSEKTLEQESQEESAFKQYQREFSEGLPSAIKSLINTARNEIIFRTDTKLGEIFNAVERIGYAKTSLRAAALLKSNKAGKSANGLRWLVADILINQTEKLIEYSRKFTAVANFLTNNKDSITMAFSITKPDDFSFYAKEQKLEKLKSFIHSQTLWEK